MLNRTRVVVWLLVALLLGPALSARAQTAPSAPGPAIQAAAAPSERTAGAAVRVEAEAPQFDLMSMLFVFMLATFIGLQVISRVSRLLHTPLMSLTNAISAIAIVGSIMVTGSNYPEPIRILGAIALFASMTNIVSGFLITDRMLKMFRQARPSAPTGGNGSPSGGQSPTVSPAS
jgi:H+-translocating NAD(P) transhydrogenase subunit alpha